MAKFDVYERRDGPGYYLDCQADLLRHLNTRFVVPLLPPGDAPLPAARLNPQFKIRGEQVMMTTQFAGAVFVEELGGHVASLSDRDTIITNALDMLISGY